MKDENTYVGNYCLPGPNPTTSIYNASVVNYYNATEKRSSPLQRWRCSCEFKSRIICSRGRCYDRNFLRFSTIFGEKIGVFLKNQCYDQFFHNLALF
jgi:hypothetical protein